MNIGGYQPCSLCDFPGQVSAVVFTQGCNFRCPFCHNAELLPQMVAAEKLIPADHVLERLTRRRGQLDAVVITGGEPTLQQDLADFLHRLREMGSPGQARYERQPLARGLCDLIAAGLLGYVAMDSKAPWRRYEDAGCVPVDVGRLRESVTVIAGSGIPHEFRTTLVPALLSEDDLDATRGQVPAGGGIAVKLFSRNTRSTHGCRWLKLQQSCQSGSDGRLWPATRAGHCTSPAISDTPQTWSATPAAMAGLTRPAGSAVAKL